MRYKTILFGIKMSTYDIILLYLKKVYEERLRIAENKLQDFIKHHPAATEKEIEEYRNNLWWKVQEDSNIESKVLEDGKFWPVHKKQALLSKVWRATVPIPIIILVLFLAILYSLFPN